MMFIAEVPAEMPDSLRNLYLQHQGSVMLWALEEVPALAFVFSPKANEFAVGLCFLGREFFSEVL